MWLQAFPGVPFNPLRPSLGHCRRETPSAINCSRGNGFSLRPISLQPVAIRSVTTSQCVLCYRFHETDVVYPTRRMFRRAFTAYAAAITIIAARVGLLLGEYRQKHRVKTHHR